MFLYQYTIQKQNKKVRENYNHKKLEKTIITLAELVAPNPQRQNVNGHSLEPTQQSDSRSHPITPTKRKGLYEIQNNKSY